MHTAFKCLLIQAGFVIAFVLLGPYPGSSGLVIVFCLIGPYPGSSGLALYFVLLGPYPGSSGLVIVFCLIGAISRVQWTCHCILSYWGHIQGPDKINTAINQTVEESLPHAVYQPLGRVIQTGLKHLYTTHVGKMTHLMIYDNTECVCNDLLFYTFFLFNENYCKSKSTNKRETLK